MLHFVFTLAEQLGEIDPYRILSLPAATLNEWQAYYRLKNCKQPDNPPVSPPRDSVQAQCEAVMKLLG
ncbi:tail assembly chaperone [Xenorhabdus littoralis]|uniref:tail assembly chaperone n=1 Tax=Xenorhabdus littoralis TaxID=2582835 RepID=UPI0029E7CE1F|nr:tail assembly chaperone [Xenorhabdus sp. psl]MDX7992223.1 tail assembly chaperone [Xenorhabdus sp. psl]